MVVATGVVFWLMRTTFTLLVAVAACALLVTVPVGRRTLFEHAVAIFSTEPARQLGEDLWDTGRAVGSKVERALEGSEGEGEGEGPATPPSAEAVASRPRLGNP